MFIRWPTINIMLFVRKLGQLELEEATDIVVDDARFNFVENEGMGCIPQQRTTEPRQDVGLRSTGYEEFDPGNLRDQPPQHEKDGGLRVFVLALVEGIDHDRGRNICMPERFDKKPLHLVMK